MKICLDRMGAKPRIGKKAINRFLKVEEGKFKDQNASKKANDSIMDGGVELNIAKVRTGSRT